MQITIKHGDVFSISLLNSFFLYSEIISAQFIRDIVNTAVAPRIASEQSPHSQHKTLEKSMLSESLHRVCRTARIILTSCREQRTYEFLIYPHKKQSYIFHFFFFWTKALFSKGLSISFISLDSINACTSQLVFSPILPLPTNTTSYPIGSFSSLRR